MSHDPPTPHDAGEGRFLASAHSTSAEKYEQHIRAGRHALVADEPEALGGHDRGPAPFALVLAGLSACTAITLKMYAERKSWDLGEVKVDLRIFELPDTHRVERTIALSAPLTDEQRAKLAEIAEKTPVTKFVKRAATVVTTFA
jgi:putative redox protein